MNSTPTKSRSDFAEFLSFFPNWRMVWLPIAGILATSCLQIASVFGFPFLNKLVFDSVLTTLDGNLLTQVSIAIFLLILFGTSFKILMDYQISHLRTKLVETLRRNAIDGILELEYLEAAGKQRGDAVQKMIGESDSIADGLAILLRNGAHIIQLAIIVSVILIIDASLLWGFLGAMAVYFLMAFPLSPLEYRISMHSGSTMGRMHSILYELFPSVKVIKCENLYPNQIERIDRVLSEAARVRIYQSLIAAFAKLGYQIPIRLAHLFILCFGFFRVRSGDYTIGTFAMVFWFVDIVLEPSARLRESIRTLVNSTASASRLRGLLAGKKDSPGRLKFHGLDSSVVFDKVSFAYNSGKVVIRDVSMEIPRGRKVCILGGSGSGKSTLANLLSGLIRPTQGKILLDGVDIGQFTRESLWSKLAVVSQDVFLFDATVRRNIDLSGTLPDSRILDACRRAELISVLERLPNGLSTLVGERGLLLSGGERQRVSLARAIAAGADILVFDEATSALDPETERRILKNLQTLEEEKGPLTLVAIAHRPDFIAAMDFAYVIEAGLVIESGTLENLAAVDGHYSRLFNANGVEKDNLGLKQ